MASQPKQPKHQCIFKNVLALRNVISVNREAFQSVLGMSSFFVKSCELYNLSHNGSNYAKFSISWSACLDRKWKIWGTGRITKASN